MVKAANATGMGRVGAMLQEVVERADRFEPADGIGGESQEAEIRTVRSEGIAAQHDFGGVRHLDGALPVVDAFAAVLDDTDRAAVGEVGEDVRGRQDSAPTLPTETSVPEPAPTASSMRLWTSSLAKPIV